MSQKVSHAVLEPKHTSKKTKQTPDLLLKDKLSERVFNIKEYHTIVAEVDV